MNLLYNYHMIYTQLRHRQFVNTALELISAQYNRNRMQLHKIMNNTNIEPISSLLNIQSYVYTDSDINEVRRLIREQIKLNKMMSIGKSMLKN